MQWAWPLPALLAQNFPVTDAWSWSSCLRSNRWKGQESPRASASSCEWNEKIKGLAYSKYSKNPVIFFPPISRQINFPVWSL